MTTLDPSELRAALREGPEAPWIVADLPFVELDDGVSYLGLPTDSLGQSLKAASSGILLSFPSSKRPPRTVDWRSREGNWVSQVRDQGRCGSCTAFALCAVVEARYRIANQATDIPIMLSPAHVFFCGTSGGCKVGMHVTDALVFAQRTGIGSEADFPYVPTDTSCRRIEPFIKLTNAIETVLDVRGFKLAISEDGPILAAMYVYEDMTFYRGGVYRHVSGALRGLHAVAVVGYDDDDGCWIVQNSWGVRFGEGGFMRIAYGECGLETFPVAVISPEVA